MNDKLTGRFVFKENFIGQVVLHVEHEWEVRDDDPYSFTWETVKGWRKAKLTDLPDLKLSQIK